MGCHALIQGIFLIQGSNLHLSFLLHGQVGSLPLAHSDMSHLRKNIVMTPFAQRTVEEQDFCCFRFPLLQSLFILRAKLAFQKGRLYNPYLI